MLARSLHSTPESKHRTSSVSTWRPPSSFSQTHRSPSFPRTTRTKSTGEDVCVSCDLASPHCLCERLKRYLDVLKGEMGAGELQSGGGRLRLWQRKLLLRQRAPIEVEGGVKCIYRGCCVMEGKAESVFQV